jgi:RNA polymerase sigma factor (sigma-70 family)
MTERTNSQLVEQARRGETEAFESLVRRHGHAAAALTRRLVTDSHHAEDVFQETLLHAWQRLSQLRDADRFAAWLAQIARNRCRQHYRRRSPELTLPALPDASARIGRSGRGTARHMTHELDVAAEALGELDGPEGQAARMFYEHGLTIREIAAASDSPEGTIKRRLYTARQRIRNEIERKNNHD